MRFRLGFPRRQPAVFIDKDGTLIDDVPFNVDPDRMRLAPGAAEGLPLLAAAGYRLIVVSNQPGVALGMFTEDALFGVRERLAALLAAVGVPLDGFYYCPHDPAATVVRYRRYCQCRKPAPGLILRAARELDVDLSRAWLIGDILDDIEAGRRAGCTSLLVNSGGETEWRLGPRRVPHHVVGDLHAAARAIVGGGRPSTRPRAFGQA